MGRLCSRYRVPALGTIAACLASFVAGTAPESRTSATARAAEQPGAMGQASSQEVTWIQAVRQTQMTGIPAVLVVTSAAVPQSHAYATSLCGQATAGPRHTPFSLAELSAQEEPEQVRRLGVTTFPTLIAYRRGHGGRIELAGAYRGTLSIEALNGWLLGLGMAPLATHAADASAATVKQGAGADVPASGADAQVHRTQYPVASPPDPSPQQPMHYPAPPKMAPPAPAPPVVCQPAPAPPRVVYRKVAPPRQVVTRRVRVVPRETVVEAPRRVRVIEAPSSAPRSLLTQPREIEEEEVEVREVEAPREMEEEVVEVREVEAPRVEERVVEVREVEAPPRVEERVVYVREAAAPQAVREAPGEVALIQPGVFDRFLGRLGRGLATRGNPRVAVETRQEVVTVAAAPRAGVVVAAPREAAPCRHGHTCGGACKAPTPVAASAPVSAPPPVYAPAPVYAPSPQSPPR